MPVMLEIRTVSHRGLSCAMPATWLTILAWISIAAGFVSAAAVLYDIYGNGLRQPMRVMEAVWPITALYLGPLGLLLYSGLGRPRRSRGALFQYFAIKPMTDLSSREALSLAIRADTLSVIAFEVGMDCPGFDGGSGVS